MSESALHHNPIRVSHPCRISQTYEIEGKPFVLREARVEDARAIRNLFDFIYNGKYPDSDLDFLAEEIADYDHNLCMVSEYGADNRIVGCLMIKMAPLNRMGKGGRALVLPEFRKGGLAVTMLKLVVDYLCTEKQVLDVIYATSRTVSAGPARVAAEAGMKQLGLFPNAVQIDTMEHLNLDIYLSEQALSKRRPRPSIIPAFQRIFDLAMQQLDVDEKATLAQLSPLPLSRRHLRLSMNTDEDEVGNRYHQYSEEDRLCHSFFPFHFPNAILASDDGGTEIFIWYEGKGKRASIVGYRSDRKNIHEILRAAAQTMEADGAAYLELLVPAHDPIAQQCAYAARFIPCAYFPSMRLARDGMREDYFVVSRTFRLLDFSDVVISPLNAKFLRAYLAGYYQLYIEPILGPLPEEVTR